MRLQVEIVSRLGGFQAQKATADDCAAFRSFSVFDDLLQIFDRAIDEYARLVDSDNRRDEGIRSRCQHHTVVWDFPARFRSDHLSLAVDLTGAVANKQFNRVVAVPVRFDQPQLVDVAMLEKRRQSDTVVGWPRLFAERQDAELTMQVELCELLTETLAHHPVSDDDNRVRSCCFRIVVDHVWLMSKKKDVQALAEMGLGTR